MGYCKFCFVEKLIISFRKKSNIVMKHSHMRVMVFAEKANRLRFDSDTIKLVTESPEMVNMTKSPCGRLMVLFI